MATKILQTQNLNYHTSREHLFKDVTVSIIEGQKIGLIGRNGCGKSSFVKILMGEFQVDDRMVDFRASEIGYMMQDLGIDADKCTDLVALAISVRQNLLDLYSEMKKLEQAGEWEKYVEVQQSYMDIGGYEIESEVEVLLNKCGFDNSEFDRNPNSLSPGQKRLVYLVGLMAIQPAVLILDEPTNHIDYELKQRYLKLMSAFTGTILVISHDRQLLEDVCSHIWEIENQNITEYRGNYTDYKIENQKILENRLNEYKKNSKYMEKVEDLAWRIKIGKASLGGRNDGSGVREIKRRLDKAKSQLDAGPKAPDTRKMELDLSYEGKKSSFLLRVNDLKIWTKEKTLSENLSFEVPFGAKLNVSGKNGAGKSTMFKVILHDCDYAEYEGDINFSPSAEVGYFNQNLEFPNEELTLYDYIGQLTGCSHNQTFGYLRRYMFDKAMFKSKILDLSGGQRNRLQIMKLVEGNYNILFLDEPTNHLDLPSIEMLEQVLIGFNGSILLISHDKDFAENVCDGVVRV